MLRSTTDRQLKGTTMIRKDSRFGDKISSRRKLIAYISAGAIAIGGGGYGIVSATASTGSATATAASSTSAISSQAAPHGGGSNARSGPAAGGSSGTVASVSSSSFTVVTGAGQKVTVKRRPLRNTTMGQARSRRVPSLRAPASSCSGRPVERGSRPARSSCNRLAATGLQPPRRQGWSPSSVVQSPPQSRPVKSQPATSKGRGRSSAERRRTKRLKLRWPPTREVSSTVS